MKVLQITNKGNVKIKHFTYVRTVTIAMKDCSSIFFLSILQFHLLDGTNASSFFLNFVAYLYGKDLPVVAQLSIADPYSLP